MTEDMYVTNAASTAVNQDVAMLCADAYLRAKFGHIEEGKHEWDLIAKAYIDGSNAMYKEKEEEVNEWKTKFENLQTYLNTQNCYIECAEIWKKNKELQEKLDFFLTEKADGKEYRPKWELEKLQEQIEKMKCCDNCKDYYKCGSVRYVCENWELKEEI